MAYTDPRTVVIGAKGRTLPCSSTGIFNYQGISENNLLFRVHESDQFFWELAIFKDSREGQNLIRQIGKSKPSSEVMDWCRAVWLKHATVDQITVFLMNLKNVAFRAGQRDKLDAIKNLLEIPT